MLRQLVSGFFRLATRPVYGSIQLLILLMLNSSHAPGNGADGLGISQSCLVEFQNQADLFSARFGVDRFHLWSQVRTYYCYYYYNRGSVLYRVFYASIRSNVSRLRRQASI